MKKTKKGILTLSCSILIVLAGTQAAIADRQTSISTGLFLRQGYDSNVDRTRTNKIEEWTTAVGPSISVYSKGSKDSLQLRYGPSYVFNHRTDDGKFDHQLHLAAERDLSERLHISMADIFHQSDDSILLRDTAATTTDIAQVTEAETTTDSTQLIERDSIQLTENRQRARYWLNSFDIGSVWEYRRNSSLSLKYRNTIYDTEGPQSDYKRHAPSLAISYEINHQWLVGGGYGFIYGEFDQADNSKQHNGHARLSYRPSPHSSLYGQGNYFTTDYDGMLVNYRITEGELGYFRQIDQKTSIDAAAGYSTIDWDDDTASEGLFSWDLSLTRGHEKGALSLFAAGGFEDQRFNGEADGLSKHWSFSAAISYALAEKIILSLHQTYSNDKFIEQVQESEQRALEAGGDLAWSFARWYTAKIRYLFREVDANQEIDDYNDHRLYLTFSAAKELWRW
jgi:hypothetical protein